MPARDKKTAHALRGMIDFIECSADAVMAVDKKGLVIAWNAAMEKLTGVGKARVIGRGGYAHSVPFFGKPKPMPLDAIVSPRIGKGYAELKSLSGGFHGEIPAPKLRIGKGRIMIWAAPIVDGRGRTIAAVQYVREIAGEKERALTDIHGLDDIQHMLDAFSEMFGIVDLDGRLITVNRAGSEFLKQTVSEISGRNISNYLDGRTSKTRKGMLAEVARRGKAVSYETVFKGRALRATFYPVSDSQGKITKVGVCAVDLTDAKKIENDLWGSQSRLKAYLENASDIITVIDREGKVILESPSFEKVVDRGKSAKPLDIDFLISQAHPEDVPRLRKEFSELLSRPGARASTIYRIKDRRGEWRVIEAFGRNLLDDEHVRGVVIAARDITGRIRIEEQLRQAEQKYRGFFENAMEGIFECAPSGRFVSMNPAMARTLGYESPDEAVREVSDIGRQVFANPGAYQKFVSLVDEKDYVRNLEVECVRKDGKRVWELVNARALRGDNGALLLIQCIAQDMTERKMLVEELLQSQKMEAIGRLAGGIAHDFNNILTSLIGNSDLLLKEIDPGGRSYQRAKVIRDTAEKASQLTRQLVAISRRQVVKPEMLDVNEVIRGMLPMLERLLGEDVKCSVETAVCLPPVKADRLQMEQVLLNLVVNARDAMPRGGRLRISTGKKVLDKDGCKGLIGARPGDYAVVTVADTGEGIPDTIISRIYEPFVTTKPAGTGLGLTIVKEAVGRWHGFILVSTEAGKGTTFEVHIPEIAAEPGEGGWPKVSTESAPQRKGKGIVMIVEDERAVMEVMADALESAGYEIVRAGSGEEALMKMGEMEGAVDLVISDVVLPGRTGIDVIKEMKVRYPRLEAVVISGYLGNTSVRDLDMDEATVFLQKPFTMDLLVHTVGQVLGF